MACEKIFGQMMASNPYSAVPLGTMYFYQKLNIGSIMGRPRTIFTDHGVSNPNFNCQEFRNHNLTFYC